MADRITWPDVAKAAVARLVEHLGYTKLEPYADLGGDSGARTLLCRPDSHDGRPVHIVVKVGPAEVLAADLAGLRLASTHFAGADYALDHESTQDGQTCVPLRLVGSSLETFDDFYRRTKNADEIVEVVDALFGTVLRHRELTTHPVSANALSLHHIGNEATLARSLREAGDAVPSLLNWWRHARETEQRASYVRLCHGDLHGRNVLISEEPLGVHVIDFGHTGSHHALRDLAKLEREVLLSLLGGAHAGRWSSGMLRFAPPELGDPEFDPELAKASQVIARLRELAQSHLPAGADVEFEYGIALFAQFMFAAANDRLPMTRRRDALAAARELRADLVAHSPELAMPSDEGLRQCREEALWRFAYAFLRLDQLPGGGWGRSLPGWMETIWAGDFGQIPRNPTMRREGGTDLTGYAMTGLAAFLGAHLTERERAEVLLHNEVLSRAYETLKGKVDFQGASGTEHPGHAHTSVKIRHTAMTVLAALRFRQGLNRGQSATRVLRDCLTYLEGHLRHWDRDTAHPFGLTMACAKLTELLGTDLVDPVDPVLVEKVRVELDATLPQMLEALENESREVAYRPTPPSGAAPRAPFFRPYCDFWRMERSGFLMYARLAVTEDGIELIKPVGRALRYRLGQCFDELLADVATPFDPTNPSASLIHYHRDQTDTTRDWGLSAELAALLAVPAINELLGEDAARRRVLVAKRSVLRQALITTFDTFHTAPHLFTYTQSPSFLQSVWTLTAATPTKRSIEEVDARVDELRRDGMPEWQLDQFIRDLVALPCGASEAVDVPGLRALLVAKLESGEYLEDDMAWQRLAESAIPPTESPHDDVVRAADDSAARGLWAALADLPPNGRALNLSSPGYEELLVDRGFEVVRVLPGHSASSRFDVVTAGASVGRMPPAQARELYDELFRLLRPGGLLLASVRLRDHALVDMDRRFVQYYREERVPRAMLENAGFRIDSIRYTEEPESASRVQWAHFVCSKPNV